MPKITKKLRVTKFVMYHTQNIYLTRISGQYLFTCITCFSITMEEAKEVHSCLKKAAGIFHYVKVEIINNY